MNPPGNSTAIASACEGHMMAKKGRAAQALATAAIGAFIGGIIATTLVVFFAPSMASLAEQFGPAEYFALALFAFVAISTVVADSVVRGLAALSIGLALAMVGIDQSTGIRIRADAVHVVVEALDSAAEEIIMVPERVVAVENDCLDRHGVKSSL